MHGREYSNINYSKVHNDTPPHWCPLTLAPPTLALTLIPLLSASTLFLTEIAIYSLFLLIIQTHLTYFLLYSFI